MFSKIEEKMVLGAIALAFVATIILSVVWHERSVGAAEATAAQWKAQAAATAVALREEKKGREELGRIYDDYVASHGEPIAPSPVYVVRYKACPAALPSAGPAAAGAVGAAASGGGDSAAPPATWDSAPLTRIGHDADARISALVKAYELARRVCSSGQ